MSHVETITEAFGDCLQAVLGNIALQVMTPVWSKSHNTAVVYRPNRLEDMKPDGDGGSAI